MKRGFRIIFATLILLCVNFVAMNAITPIDSVQTKTDTLLVQQVAQTPEVLAETNTKTAAELEWWEFFDWSAMPYYFLGLLAFFAILLNDYFNKKEQLHKPSWYVQEFIYTIIAIALGIYVCRAFEFSIDITKIIAIVCGLIGTTIIRTFLKRKQGIADSVVDKVEDKIGKQ